MQTRFFFLLCAVILPFATAQVTLSSNGSVNEVNYFPFLAFGERGYDFEEIKNQDGSYTKTLGLDPYIFDNSTGTFVPFINSGLLTETEHGSVFLNSDGSYLFYKNGKVDSTHLFSDKIIGKYADISDLTTWTYPNTLNNDAPDLSWSDNSFASSKVKSGIGILEYKYILNYGKWKTQLEVTNLSSLDTKVFGFDQIIDLERDTIKFGGQTRNLDNFDGVTFDRTWIENNESKIIDFTNGFYFDFDLGFDNLYSITVYDTGVNKSRLVFDYRTDTILLPNETLIIDPTFGKLSNNYGKMIQDQSANAVTTCDNLSLTNSIASTSILKRQSSSTTIDTCDIFGVVFPLNQLPSDIDVTNSILNYDITAATNGINCDYVSVSVDIQTDTNQNIWNAIVGGTDYVTNDAGCATTGTGKTLDLGTSFDTAIETNNGDELTLGFLYNSMVRDASLHIATFTNISLTITYNLPPDPPKQFSGSVTPSTGVVTTWSAGDNNGDTHQSYQVERYNGSTWVELVSQSGTGYTDTEPLTQDETKYRIFDTGILGVSCYQSLMNSTILANLTSHFPLCYTVNDNGIENNDATVTGNQLYTNSSGTVSQYFDGTSYDTLPNEADYDFEYDDPFSFSFWVYPATGIANQDVIIAKSNDIDSAPVGAGYGILYGTVSNNVSIRLVDAANNIVAGLSSSASSVPLDTWTFVTMTYAGNSNQDGLKFYINGDFNNQGASSIIGASILNNLAVVIGAESDGARIFNGNIRDMQIYDIELDAHQVDQLYNEYIDTYTLAVLPPPITDLTASGTTLSSITLDWTEPTYVFGTCEGYQINYTTPLGDPQTIITNSTGNCSTVAYEVGSLTIGADYSFRVSPVTEYGKNDNGNIANATAFNEFTIGDMNFPTESNSHVDVLFVQTEYNDTAKQLDVIYPDDVTDFRCDVFMQFANNNQTYANMTSDTYDSNYNYTSFIFNNSDNEIINLDCYDYDNLDVNGNHVILQSAFPLVDQINDFRNGVTFGSGSGDFGGLDLITLVVIIVSMVGFSKSNPAAGIIISVMILGVTSYFGIIVLPTTIISSLVLAIVIAVVVTRK